VTTGLPGSQEDWSGLARQWQARSEPIALPIDGLLRRERFRWIGMALLIGFEVALSVGALAVSWWARGRLGPIGLTVVALYIALIWGFAVWNRRGTWRPDTRTVEAFVRLYRLRCERGLRSTRFALVVVMLQAMVTLAAAATLLIRQAPNALPRALVMLGTSAAVSAGFLVWAVWYRRLITARLERLENAGLNTEY
jgi:hypothetical protein